MKKKITLQINKPLKQRVKHEIFIPNLYKDNLIINKIIFNKFNLNISCEFLKNNKRLFLLSPSYFKINDRIDLSTYINELFSTNDFTLTIVNNNTSDEYYNIDIIYKFNYGNIVINNYYEYINDEPKLLSNLFNKNHYVTKMLITSEFEIKEISISMKDIVLLDDNKPFIEPIYFKCISKSTETESNEIINKNKICNTVFEFVTKDVNNNILEYIDKLQLHIEYTGTVPKEIADIIVYGYFK